MKVPGSSNIYFAVLLGLVTVLGVTGSSYSVYIYAQKALNQELDRRIVEAARQAGLALEELAQEDAENREMDRAKAFLVSAIRKSSQLETLTAFDLKRKVLFDARPGTVSGKRLTHFELPQLAVEKVSTGQDFFRRRSSVEELSFRSAAVPLRDSQGRIIGGVYAKANIHFEDSLVSLRENWIFATLFALIASTLFVSGLVAAYRKLNSMEKALQKRGRLDLISQMSAGIAHDIKNPLASITMSAQLLEEDVKDREESMELVHFIHNGCASILEILENLLGTGAKSKPQPIKVKTFVSSVVRQLQPTATKERVQLIIDMSQDVFVCAPPTPLRMALANIVHNAIQAIDHHQGRISLSLRSENRQVGIVVSDNGPGIPAALQKKIFDPLVTTKEGGSGLGLPTARQTLEDMEGKLEMESEVGRGTTFILWVPLVDGEQFENSGG